MRSSRHCHWQNVASARTLRKFDWVIDRIEKILESAEQVVVFSHFLDLLDLLERIQQENGTAYIRIDGSTNNRQTLIDRFNAGQAKVALCSLIAAGYGINLTAANHVIHADRVHRIGQDRTVYVYRILVEGTLEERIDQLLAEKQGMSDQILAAATERTPKWSREELMELLKPLDD